VNERYGKIELKVVIGVLIASAVVVGIGAVALVDTTGEKGSGLSEAYNLDPAKLAKFDPNLLHYEEAITPIPTGFARSRGLALDAEGRFYVAGDEAIRVLSRTGNLERIVSLARSPHCVAVAADGKLYVGLRDHVEVFDAAGQSLGSWDKLGPRAFLTSIIVTKNDVFVADAGNSVVLRYDLAGQLVGRIGEKDADRDIPGFYVPSPYFDLAMAPDGLLRVVSPGRLRVEAYTPDGDLEFWWGEASTAIDGFSGCCNPVNFALVPDGGFVTTEKGLPRVKIYDISGAFRSVVAGADALNTVGLGIVFDVAVDSQGRIFLLDPIKRAFRIFTLIQEAES